MTELSPTAGCAGVLHALLGLFAGGRNTQVVERQHGFIDPSEGGLIVMRSAMSPTKETACCGNG